MLNLPIKRTFDVTPTTPTTLTTSLGITPSTTLSFTAPSYSNTTYTLSCTCSKILIYNTSHLTLLLPSSLPITSTIELFSSSQITLLISPSSPGTSQLGILQLDPPLKDISIRFGTADNVGNVVVAPRSVGVKSGLDNVKLSFGSRTSQEGGQGEFILADEQGRLHDPNTGEVLDVEQDVGEGDVRGQWVVRLWKDESEKEGGKWGWKGEELKRVGGREYPVLG